MAINAEHRSKFATLHRQWWCLQMSEKFSSRSKNSKQTNIYVFCCKHYWISFIQKILAQMHVVVFYNLASSVSSILQVLQFLFTDHNQHTDTWTSSIRILFTVCLAATTSLGVVMVMDPFIIILIVRKALAITTSILCMTVKWKLNKFIVKAEQSIKFFCLWNLLI